MYKSLAFNYHGHTRFSDGKADFSDFIDEALQQGFKAIGFSDHTPVPFTSSWNMQSNKIEEYLSNLSSLKKLYEGKIQIYAGLEVDYFGPYHERIISMASIDRLDYFIGSIHYLGFLDEAHPWCIDTSYDEFEQGFKKIFNNNGRLLYTKYYEALLQMIERWKPTIIGHMDKIKMYNHLQTFFDEHEQSYRSMVIEVLDLIKKYDLFVELNMRGFYKHPQKFIYPSEWVLKEVNRRGIRLVVSSDCHQPSELSAGFPEALEMIKSVGFGSVWCLYDNCWQEIAIT
jgi:histidinol-phosphatase (PHP family)